MVNFVFVTAKGGVILKIVDNGLSSNAYDTEFYVVPVFLFFFFLFIRQAFTYFGGFITVCDNFVLCMCRLIELTLFWYSSDTKHSSHSLVL